MPEQSDNKSAGKKKSPTQSKIVPFKKDGAAKAREAQCTAQDLIYDALETPSRGKRVSMAREALKLWPDCADAWNLLAEEAGTPEEMLRAYEEAVAAGERALGKRAFKDAVGYFWGLLETRPYMRARMGLAQTLEHAGRVDEAIPHYRELLRLNPNDNQGIRYVVLHALIVAGRDDEARTFMSESPADSAAAWLYPKALLAFRRDGRSEKTDRLLRKAIERNRFVPRYLMGRKRMPRELPDYIGFGDEDEAVAFVFDYQRVWQETAGAVEWLKAVAK